ncbi:unnamed protein product, partial [marine sediment metagenome]
LWNFLGTVSGTISFVAGASLETFSIVGGSGVTTLLGTAAVSINSGTGALETLNLNSQTFGTKGNLSFYSASNQPTITRTVAGTVNLGAMLMSANITNENGGMGFTSGHYGLNATVNETSNIGGSGTDDHLTRGMAAVLTYYGESNRTKSTIDAFFCQGVLRGGAVTDARGFASQSGTVLSGTITNSISVDCIGPFAFLGGVSTNAISLRVNVPAVGVTKWCLAQPGTTGLSYFEGFVSVNKATAPFYALDAKNIIRIDDTNGFAQLLLGGTGLGDYSVRAFVSTAPGKLVMDGNNGIFNRTMQIDLEQDTHINFTSSDVSSIRFQFQKVYLGYQSSVPNDTSDNHFLRISSPTNRTPDTASGADYYDTHIFPEASLDLTSQTYANIVNVRLANMAVTHTSAAVTGNYVQLMISGAPQGG